MGISTSQLGDEKANSTLICLAFFLHGCVQGDVRYATSPFSGQSVIRRLRGDAQGEQRRCHLVNFCFGEKCEDSPKFYLKRLKFELELSFFFSKPRNAREILDTTCAPACKRCFLASFTSRPAHAAPWSRQSTAPNNRGFRTIWLRYVLRKHPANAIPEILLAYPPHCPFRVSRFQCTPSRKALASPRLEIESRYTWRRRPFALSLTPPSLLTCQLETSLPHDLRWIATLCNATYFTPCGRHEHVLGKEPEKGELTNFFSRETGETLCPTCVGGRDVVQVRHESVVCGPPSV